jgi:hypothetical protein
MPRTSTCCRQGRQMPCVSSHRSSGSFTPMNRWHQAQTRMMARLQRPGGAQSPCQDSHGVQVRRPGLERRQGWRDRDKIGVRQPGRPHARLRRLTLRPLGAHIQKAVRIAAAESGCRWEASSAVRSPARRPSPTREASPAGPRLAAGQPPCREVTLGPALREQWSGSVSVVAGLPLVLSSAPGEGSAKSRMRREPWEARREAPPGRYGPAGSAVSWSTLAVTGQLDHHRRDTVLKRESLDE